jgi:HlyD family secretion protein
MGTTMQTHSIAPDVADSQKKCVHIAGRASVDDHLRFQGERKAVQQTDGSVKAEGPGEGFAQSEVAIATLRLTLPPVFVISRLPCRGSALDVLIVAVACTLAGCARTDEDRVQGYIEGQFVYVASPLAGTLETLDVQRGAQVKTGEPLFALDGEPQRIARDEAARRLAQARATLEDMGKGKRPSEIEAIEAQLQQARAALTLAEKELARQEELARTGAARTQDLDQARATHDQSRQQVAQLAAELATAQLGAREDQIAAAQANVEALEAALAKAQWDLSQTRQAAPRAGLVFDTLYRQGEWVPAGRPAVMLLPPENIRVRAFVSETRVGAIQPGDPVQITVDGLPAPLAGKVSFISPRAEYTPPVIYSRQSRSKLVFLVEAVFDPNVAATLHPGQPVDVEFGS